MKRDKAPHSVLTSVLQAGDQFTRRGLNNRKMSQRYPLNRRLCGPHIRSDLSGERNISTRSMVTIPTELPRFSLNCRAGYVHPFICSCIHDPKKMNTVRNNGCKTGMVGKCDIRGPLYRCLLGHQNVNVLCSSTEE
jgi:hypothetical protein